MKYNSDGTIPTLPFWSKEGVEQLEPLNPFVKTEAETICYSWRTKSEVCSEGGINVGHIENGDYIKVKGVDFGNGASSFEARVASNTEGGNIEIRLNSISGQLIGTCTVPGTGGWQEWVTQGCSVIPVKGVHDLFFVFTGGSDYLLNFNWWQFFEADPPTPVVTPSPQQEPVFSGGPYDSDVGTAYTSLPDGIFSEIFDFTISCRINLKKRDNWARVFDFGQNTDIYMMLTPSSGNTGYPCFCITVTGNSGEQVLNGIEPFPLDLPQYITITKQGTIATLYINSQQVDQNNNMLLNPADMGKTLNNYIGRSQWEQDPYLDGTVDNFRIYNRALSNSEIERLVGFETNDLGDVNSDNKLNIVDALLIAQHYVGLPITGNFHEVSADVNCDGSINIVDALLVAQFYVGLINRFC